MVLVDWIGLAILLIKSVLCAGYHIHVLIYSLALMVGTQLVRVLDLANAKVDFD